MDINEIDALIQKDVQNRTFSLEAVEAIGAMRKSINNLERENKTLTSKCSTWSDLSDKQDDKIEGLQASVKQAKDEIEGFAKRQAIHATQDTELAVARALKQLAVDMAMGLVKNNSFRETTFTSTSGAVMTDENGYQVGQEPDTITNTDKTVASE